jgi:hypothetical protein
VLGLSQVGGQRHQLHRQFAQAHLATGGLHRLRAQPEHYEQSVFDHPLAYTLLVAILLIAALILWLFNRHQAKSAMLYYEESEPEVITTIGIGSWQPINQEVSAQNH